MILFGVAVAVFAVISVGERQGLMKEHFYLSASFKNITGLQPGAPVNIAGYRIGVVDKIQEGDITILVKLKIEKRAQRGIRIGSTATIKNAGLLGDKFVEIVPGVGDQPVLQNGETIATVNIMPPEEILNCINEISDNLYLSAMSLNVIVKKVENGTGSLGKILNDPRMSTDLDSLLATTTTMIEDIKESKGTIGFLCHNPFLYDNINQGAQRAGMFVASVLEGQGRAGNAVCSSESYRAFTGTLKMIDSTSTQLEKGQGFFGTISKEDNLYNDFAAALSKLDNLISDINKNVQ